MARRGTCCLCGTDDVQLTDDHIQPQCAFNEKDRKYVRLESPLDSLNQPRPAPSGKPYRNIYYEIQPDKPIAGGIYRRTQCSDCNGLLGQHYDRQFGQFCHDAVTNMKLGSIVVVSKSYRQQIRFPLSILKRVLAMFCSINGSQFVRGAPQLSKFIRQMDNQALPEQYRVFVGYNANDLVSHIPYQVRTSMGSKKYRQMCQISHPPFVYLLTIDTPCPDNRLVEFTEFAQYAYGEEANVVREFRLLPTNNCFAGDFRESGKVIPNADAILTTEVRPSYYRLVDSVI